MTPEGSTAQMEPTRGLEDVGGSWSGASSELHKVEAGQLLETMQGKH